MIKANNALLMIVRVRGKLNSKIQSDKQLNKENGHFQNTKPVLTNLIKKIYLWKNSNEQKLI